MAVVTIPYTPAEVEACTGRSVESQRNDRRSGFSPQHEGHARYDMHGVARNYVIQCFADMGVRPSRTVRFADEAAMHIAQNLNARAAAWTDNALRTIDYKPSGEFLVGGAYSLSRLLPKFYDGPTFGLGIVLWADDSFEITSRFWELFGKAVPGDPKLRGPAVMLGFVHASIVVGSKLPRPMYDLVPDSHST